MNLELSRLNRIEDVPSSGAKVLDSSLYDSSLTLDGVAVSCTPPKTYLECVKSCCLPLASIFLTFTVTLATFPGLTSLLAEHDDAFSAGPAWYNVLLVTVFNLGDVIGRGTTGYIASSAERGGIWTKTYLPSTSDFKYKVFLPVLLRFSFLYIFPFIIVHPTPPLISFLVVVLMASTNGYLASMSMMVAPQTIEGDDLAKEKVVNIMLFGLFAGLSVGSMVGTGIEACL